MKILLPQRNLVEEGLIHYRIVVAARAKIFRVVKKISIHDMCDLCGDGGEKNYLNKNYLINLCCV